jgi:hypothetical protein
MYAMPPYPYLATDYGTQLSLFTHHNWIGGFCIVGAGAHAAIFMVRDYDPASSYNNLLDRVIRHRDAIISHLNWVCIFLGFHSFGLYIHNDTMSALGRPQDMFSDTAIQLQPVFAQWIQNTHFAAPQLTAPNALAATSATWGGDLVAVGGKVAMMPISLGTSDFLVWLVLDQVKLRYMLEQLAKVFKLKQAFFRFSKTKISVLIFKLFMKFFEQINVLKSHALNIYQIFEVMKNLFERVDQQVILLFNLTQIYSVKEEDTSETTREAMLQQNFNFDFTDYNAHKPSHIKNLDENFLTWFIGFVEGDGSFWTRFTSANAEYSHCSSSFQANATNKRVEFEITQHEKNIRVLYYIRTKLGFGRVITYQKDGQTYGRWFTSKKENILRLVYLLNGNLILEKRREQFKEWVKEINLMWNLTLPIKNSTLKVSFQNAWFAGFVEADGGFYTNVLQNFKYGKRPKGGYYVKFKTVFYITQLGELEFLEDIQALVGCTTKIGTVTNGRTKVLYNRLTITPSNCINLLLNYFTKFPLKGSKNIDLLRFARIHGYKQMQRVVTEKAAERLAKLILSLQDPNYSNSIDLETFSTAFSEKEKNAFINLD